MKGYGTMTVQQFVIAYEVEQDKLRAMLPEGFSSLRPVLRINAEIREDNTIYLELNTPVSAQKKRGWLNIAHWDNKMTEIIYQKNGKTTTFITPFLTIRFTTVGIEGSCPAEKDNDGCFFIGKSIELRFPEQITANKEFCDCEFAWKFSENDAHGISTGKTLPAFATEPKIQYPKQKFTAQNAAIIPCQQVLGCYAVTFEQ